MATEYSAPTYELREQRAVMVPMRDGVRLALDLYLPQTSEKLPALLSTTPYGRGDPRDVAQWFARRGYVVAVADVRGRFDSEGSWDPFNAKHKTDGYDLVEWLARQPWSTGKVGMIGTSYAGWTQWWTATTAPPHLAAIVPESAPPDAFESAPYQNGVLTGWFMHWAAYLSGRTLQIVDEGPYGGWLRQHDLTHTPYIDINTHRGLRNAPWFPTLYEQNVSTSPYWHAISYQGAENYGKIKVPSLSISGWFDVVFPGTPMNYIGMRQYGDSPAARRPTMIIGPWNHRLNQRVVADIDYGAAAQLDLNGYIARWLDHFVKGIDNGVEHDPPVYVFVMGENRWHAAHEWPLSDAIPTAFYLTSQGHANSLNGDGVLTTSRPERPSSDVFEYDPRHPTLDAYRIVPNHNGHIDGAVDTRIPSTGQDVLVYQTPPLKAPLKVIGPIEATLYASTSARDTDWFVRLVDVQPSGRALLLAEGAMRARNRDPTHEGRFNPSQLSTIEPGKIYQYTIHFWRGTANLFARGHRIRVEISSSWCPSYLPNLNSGADNVAMVHIANAVVAQQSLFHGDPYPSRIVLPVVPADTPQDTPNLTAAVTSTEKVWS